VSNLKIEGGVVTSSSSTIGTLEERVYHHKISFFNLVKKFAGWALHKELLEHADTFTYEVEEENGTEFPDKHIFTITKEELNTHHHKLKYVDDVIIIPLSLFKYHTNTSKTIVDKVGIEWFTKLRGEFHKPYMKDLSKFVQGARKEHAVFPNPADVFRAFRLTPFSQVKVVVLGQDPYHNGLASGLSFSTNNELITPRSLENIFTEIENDVYNGLMLDRSPSLERWAGQGVLLLNTILTVRQGTPLSHQGKGWETFTNQVIKSLYEVKRPIVWLLWGEKARKSFSDAISDIGTVNDQQLILSSAHPSPLSASKFFGCKHFSKTNKFLQSKHQTEIVW
jgi:uracil-DNA glycosylase